MDFLQTHSIRCADQFGPSWPSRKRQSDSGLSSASASGNSAAGKS
jgi:hypothetical protein